MNRTIPGHGWRSEAILGFLGIGLLLPANLLRGLAAETPPVQIKVWIATGQDYPGHVWRETSPVLRKLLEPDPRFVGRILEDPNAPDSAAPTNYQVLLLHFENWETPGQAKSQVDQRAHPMAFTRDYGWGRVFLTTLDHDVKAFANAGGPHRLRQGGTWATGLPSM